MEIFGNNSINGWEIIAKDDITLVTNPYIDCYFLQTFSSEVIEAKIVSNSNVLIQKGRSLEGLVM